MRNIRPRKFDAGIAINTRKESALESFGHTREAIRKNLVATVLCNIRMYSAAYEVKTEEDFVNMMRKLGGFTAMIQTAIGKQPYEANNEIGMATNPAYWVWVVKQDMISEIRMHVQLGLQKEVA